MEEEKKVMLGKMAVNDLAGSSFTGVTPHVTVYRRIGMHTAAGVRDVNRNRFLARPVSKEEIKDNSRGLYRGLPEELQVSAIMMCMEDAPKTIRANRDSLLE